MTLTKESIKSKLELIGQCKEMIKLYNQLAEEKPHLKADFTAAVIEEEKTIDFLQRRLRRAQ